MAIRIVRPRRASQNPTYRDSGAVWWALAAAAAGGIYLLSRVVGATRPTATTPDGAPGAESRRRTLAQRLAADEGAALNFYLQAQLYSWGFSDIVPSGVWSGAWSAAYERAKRLAGPLGRFVPGSTEENVYVVNHRPYPGSGRRLVPVQLSQPLINQINGLAGRYGATEALQVRSA